MVSLEQLLDAVQASRAEICATLEALHAIEVAGHWRLLSPAYQLSVFRKILNAAEQEVLTERGEKRGSKKTKTTI